jgi:hypothetical protein
MESGLSAFDRQFLQGVNICTDRVRLRRPGKASPRRVRPSEIVTYWEDLPCTKTLDEVHRLTDLVRYLVGQFAMVYGNEAYKGVLKKIHAGIANIHERYPGCEYSDEKGEAATGLRFLICNVGTIPLTAEGIEFLEYADDLLENKKKQLAAIRKKNTKNKKPKCGKLPQSLQEVLRMWSTAGVRTPETIEDLVADEWDQDGGFSEEPSDDYKTSEGRDEWVKKTGNVKMDVDVPYTTVKTYGKPIITGVTLFDDNRNPIAFLNFVEGQPSSAGIFVDGKPERFPAADAANGK